MLPRLYRKREQKEKSVALARSMRGRGVRGGGNTRVDRLLKDVATEEPICGPWKVILYSHVRSEVYAVDEHCCVQLFSADFFLFLALHSRVHFGRLFAAP